jgi:hypothetical protein
MLRSERARRVTSNETRAIMGPAAATTEREEMWRRWIVLAGFLLVISGAFNVVTGLGFLFDDVSYGAAETPFVDVVAWGWFLAFVGVCKLAAGLGLYRRRIWAVAVGLVFASLNLLAHMALLPAYPLLSTLIIVLDAVVLWALVAHGSRY